MDSTAIAEYLSRFLKEQDEDAFHSLIEEGDPSVEAVRAALLTCTDEQFKLLIEVLQEIRTEFSRTTLADLCMRPYSERWEVAAEGLFYNDTDLARPVFQRILAEERQRGGGQKSALMEELLTLDSKS